MLTIVKKNKADLRSLALALRKTMLLSGLTKTNSSKIVQKIILSDDFKKSKNIALYYPLQGEVDLKELLKIENKRFFLPKCNGLELEFIEYKGEEFLQAGKYNIKEPVGEKINPEILDLIYIPALIVNSSKYRLGYGKGYYDRFLNLKSENLKAKKITVIQSAFLNDEFIQDDFDIQSDEIITENFTIC